MAIEDTFAEIAKKKSDGKPVLILCDRGTMDGAAYVPKETFDKILKSLGVNSVFEVKDKRYDLVVHLVSAALGAEEHYSLANNAARTESYEEAREVDKRVMDAWTGHPSVVCINNRTQFKEKVIRALQAICKKVDAPIIGASTVKRKFLVSAINEENFQKIHYHDAVCEYTYIQDLQYHQRRIRKRGGIDSLFIYSLIIRFKGESGEYERYTETSRNITAREYESLKSMALPTHHSAIITKRSFMYNSQYFSLAIFSAPHSNLMLLELYEEADITVDLPTHLMTIEKEVTTDSTYSLHTLCNKNSNAQ